MTAATSRGSNAKRILSLLSVVIDLDYLGPPQLRLGTGHQHFQTRPRHNQTVIVDLYDKTLLDQRRNACMQRIGRLAGQRCHLLTLLQLPCVHVEKHLLHFRLGMVDLSIVHGRSRLAAAQIAVMCGIGSQTQLDRKTTPDTP